MAKEVAKHIAEYSTTLPSGRVWLPAVWSEDNPTLRSGLEEKLGRPVPSGYMSEECGWEIETGA